MIVQRHGSGKNGHSQAIVHRETGPVIGGRHEKDQWDTH
jgi:hypothetical protein